MPRLALDLDGNDYWASLAAFTKLGRQKGYRLVGVQSLGFNAVFVQDGVGEGLLPAVTPRECFDRVERLRDARPEHVEQIVSGGEPWEEV